MLLVASHPQAHGKAWLVSDGSCSWREFLAFLLPESADKYPDHPADYFRILQRESKMSITQLLSQLAAFPPLRRWLRERSIVGWLRKSVPFKKASKPRLLSGQTQKNECSSPAPWLVDIFGLSCTVYDATALRELGWQSRVGLSDGMKRTLEWLSLHVGKYKSQ